jgi:hypothetical protein
VPKDKKVLPVSLESVERRIYLIRGHKVLLDFDLASLYGVETKVLNQAVTRNLDRFPVDFCFRLNRQEVEEVYRSQFVTSSLKHRDSRYPPRAFTEQGVAMLSSVLRSKQAVQVNIAVNGAPSASEGVDETPTQTRTIHLSRTLNQNPEC